MHNIKIKQTDILFAGLIAISIISAGMISSVIVQDESNEKYTKSYFAIRDTLVEKIQTYSLFEDSVSAKLVQINLTNNHVFYLDTYIKNRQMAREGERMKSLLGSWQNANTSTWSIDSTRIVTGLEKNNAYMHMAKNDLIRLEKRVMDN